VKLSLPLAAMLECRLLARRLRAGIVLFQPATELVAECFLGG
jgi:hypothetical protein